VLDYCIKNGSKRFVEDCRDSIDRFDSLRRFVQFSDCWHPCCVHCLQVGSDLEYPCVPTAGTPDTALYSYFRFDYVEPDTGKDQGINVREKSKQLVELLSSADRLSEEREKVLA